VYTFYIHQKFTFFANQYRVFTDRDGRPGELVAFAHQKRLAVKESISFHRDESKREPVFGFQARNILELAATYDVHDERGAVLGHLQKKFSASLARSTWHVLAPGGGGEGGVVAIVQERSLALAVVRRVWNFVPFVGDLPFFLRYHFDFRDPVGQAVLGTFTKTTLFRDHYRLEVGDQLATQCDWRVLVAMGVALDALQSR
jgi:uncharacterized protein YxjI